MSTAHDAPFTLDTLRSLFEDDVDAIREILDTYIDDLKKNATDIAEAAIARDRKTTGRVAHSMKGASANVGAEAFAARCAAVEKRCPDAPWDELDGLVAALANDALRVADEVRRATAGLR